MKTCYLKVDWLIPLAGIAVVAASLVAGSTYLRLERKIQADEAFAATLDRLFQDQTICAALKNLKDGEMAVAAQHLDLRLCGNILQSNADLETADARTRACVQSAFRRMATIRPKTAAGATAGPALACNGDQMAAQRILELALAGDKAPAGK